MNTPQLFKPYVVQVQPLQLCDFFHKQISTIDLLRETKPNDQYTEETLEISKSEDSSLGSRQLIGNKRGRKPKNLKQCIKCSVDDCDMLLETLSEMTKHMSTSHLKVIHCDNCICVFDKEINYLKHKKSHLPSQKKYLCPYPKCGKRFTASYNLKIHYRVHSGERPFKCDQCENDYYDRANYKYHMRTAHMILNSKEKQCVHQGCCHEFKTKKQKYIHHDKLDEECSSDKSNLIRLISLYSNAIEDLIVSTKSKNNIKGSNEYIQAKKQRSITNKAIQDKEQYEAFFD